jgi:hypothetical protein
MTVKARRLVLLCCLAAIWNANGLAQTKAQPPDVFLVTPRCFLVPIDTLHADHVHCFGYDSIETPALEMGRRKMESVSPKPLSRAPSPIVKECALFKVPQLKEASLGLLRSGQALRFGPLPAGVLFLSQLSVDIGQELMGIG